MPAGVVRGEAALSKRTMTRARRRRARRSCSSLSRSDAIRGGAVARREELARMRVEGQHAGGSARSSAASMSRDEHRLVAAMHAVEIADGQRDGAVGRRRQAANHPHRFARLKSCVNKALNFSGFPGSVPGAARAAGIPAPRLRVSRRSPRRASRRSAGRRARGGSVDRRGAGRAARSVRAAHGSATPPCRERPRARRPRGCRS